MQSFCYISPPPTIHHVPRRPKEYRSMLQAAANNIHLRKQAKKLLEYYASQCEGFSPALALIEAKTKIPPNKISEIRQRLAQRGLIFYDRNNCEIYISWDRIGALAMLDKPLHFARDGSCTVFPFQPMPNGGRRLTIGEMNRHSYQPFNWDVLTPEQIREIKIIEKMTPWEYNEILDAWKRIGETRSSLIATRNGKEK